MTTALQRDLFAPRWVTPLPTAPAVGSGASRRPYVDPFLEDHRKLLDAAGDTPLPLDAATWDHAARSACALDVECFVNFFVVCLRRLADGKTIAFEGSSRCELDRAGLLKAIEHNLIITFNGRSYDLVMIYLALAGLDTVTLKAASDRIILQDEPSWSVAQRYGVRVPSGLNHIDLVDTNPAVRQGLKILQARLHGRYVVDLPFSPDAELTPRQMNYATLYCLNDLDGTANLYAACLEPVKLRHALGQEFGMDLRSKSDTQVGEAIVLRSVERATGRRIPRPNGAAGGAAFRYSPPAWTAGFTTPFLRGLVSTLAETTFHLNAAGKVTTPRVLEGLTVPLGAGRYAMGIGGLHSTEAHRALCSTADRQLLDVDVASQYPNIILQLGLYPAALGPAFLDIYGELVRRRLAAKAAGDKVWADGGRIAANGVYGKLGEPHGALYAPHLMIATTLTGQLSILLLIERAESAGVPVVSANTDGVVFYAPRARLPELDSVLASWQSETGLKLEMTPYRALYNASVNTYLALREDGKVKRKGFIADPWADGDLRGMMMKNPQMTICSEAVKRLVVDGTPLEETIRGVTDPRAFVTVIKVAEGGVWRGHPLGRAVRYYWATDGDAVVYAKSGKRVPKTEGARPLPRLDLELPPDVDYLRYGEEAARLARDLGVPEGEIR